MASRKKTKELIRARCSEWVMLEGAGRDDEK